MKKTVIAAAVFAAVLGGASARAFYVTPSVTQLTGSRAYEGTGASVDLGGAFHLTPAFSTYHADYTGGNSYKTYSLRAGYDTSLWGLGVSGGATPQVGSGAFQYKNDFYGVDGVLSFGPGSGKTSHLRQYMEAGGAGSMGSMSYRTGGLSGLEVGAGVMHYDHDTAGVKIGQTNLHGKAGAVFFDNIITVDITKSAYNGSLAASSPAQVQMIQGVNAIVQGFPDSSVSLKLAAGLFPMVTPYVSYTHTTFKNGVGASGAYVLGGSVNLLMLNVHAFYERYSQIGSADRNFVGVGAGLNF